MSESHLPSFRPSVLPPFHPVVHPLQRRRPRQGLRLDLHFDHQVPGLLVQRKGLLHLRALIELPEGDELFALPLRLDYGGPALALLFPHLPCVGEEVPGPAGVVLDRDRRVGLGDLEALLRPEQFAHAPIAGVAAQVGKVLTRRLHPPPAAPRKTAPGPLSAGSTPHAARIATREAPALLLALGGIELPRPRQAGPAWALAGRGDRSREERHHRQHDEKGGERAHEREPARGGQTEWGRHITMTTPGRRLARPIRRRSFSSCHAFPRASPVRSPSRRSAAAPVCGAPASRPRPGRPRSGPPSRPRGGNPPRRARIRRAGARSERFPALAGGVSRGSGAAPRLRDRRDPSRGAEAWPPLGSRAGGARPRGAEGWGVVRRSRREPAAGRGPCGAPRRAPGGVAFAGSGAARGGRASGALLWHAGSGRPVLRRGDRPERLPAGRGVPGAAAARPPPPG